jgi:hypothetical protein
MAADENAQNSLLLAIHETVEFLRTSGHDPITKAGALRALAQAYALASRPDVPHGITADTK